MPESTAFDAAARAQAADRLATAWRSGRPFDALPEPLRPRSLADGYDLQDALIAATGEPRHGWKIGLGSPRNLAKAGMSRPVLGQLVASRIHPAGATVAVLGDAPITIEFEVAFVLGRDIAPGALHGPLLDAVESVHLTFELVRSRFVDRLAVGWPSFVGDNVGFEALVVGPALSFDAVPAITREAFVEVDGALRARAMTGDELSSPEGGLRTLLVHAAEREVTLRRGEIVTTGAIARPFDLDGGADVVARFPGGTLQVRIERRAA